MSFRVRDCFGKAMDIKRVIYIPSDDEIRLTFESEYNNSQYWVTGCVRDTTGELIYFDEIKDILSCAKKSF